MVLNRCFGVVGASGFQERRVSGRCRLEMDSRIVIESEDRVLRAKACRRIKENILEISSVLCGCRE